MGIDKGGKPSSPQMFRKGHRPGLSNLGESFDLPEAGRSMKWPLWRQILFGTLPDLWAAQEF